MAHLRIIPLFLLITIVAIDHGTVKHVPLRSNVALKPGEVYIAQLESTKVARADEVFK